MEPFELVADDSIFMLWELASLAIHTELYMLHLKRVIEWHR